MKRLLRLLDDFWFAEAPASRLATLRVLIGAYALYYVGTRYSMLVEVGGTRPSLFDPVGVAAFLDQPLAPVVFQVLVIATLVANVAFLLGWQYRYAGPAFAVLLLWVLCYRNSWSMIYHSDNVLVLHVLILGLTRAADALSLDARARSRRVRANVSFQALGPGMAEDRRAERVAYLDTNASCGWQYGWPIRLMCAVAVLAYFVTGVAKVAGPLGWSWAHGEALLSQVAADGLRKDLLGAGASPWISTLYDYVFLFAIMGVGSLALELGAPVALLNKRLSLLWAVSTFLMHWGIFFIMGITFRYQLSGMIFAPFFMVKK
ncbi:MAG: hypothetical protein ACREQ3_20750 [Candidatus Binatia bacterium]